MPLRIARPLLIRSARLSDTRALHRACFPEQPFEQMADYLEWCLTSDTRPARLVAFEGEALVGHVEVTGHRHRVHWAEVSSLIVTPPRRGAGIGGRLIGAAQRLARRWGCHEVRLQVSAREPDLIDMYQRWGFASRGLPLNHMLWMSRPLQAQPLDADLAPAAVVHS